MDNSASSIQPGGQGRNTPNSSRKRYGGRKRARKKRARKKPRLANTSTHEPNSVRDTTIIPKPKPLVSVLSRTPVFLTSPDATQLLSPSIYGSSSPMISGQMYACHSRQPEREYSELCPTSLETLVRERVPVNISHKIDSVADLPVDGGGFGHVRIGRMNGELIAVKVLTMGGIRGDISKQRVTIERRLKREITVWAALKHPNIAKFEGYMTGISEYPAMVSKWCRNGNAAWYLDANPSIPLQRRILLGQDVAKGLAYLHSLKIIHGDLKPQNVLVNDEGNAQLCDFGLARIVGWQGRRGMTTTTPYGGTLKYKAYELFSSKSNRNPQPTFSSDVYALGCVLYEFACLKQPFHDLEIVELIDAIKVHAPPAIRPHTLNADERQLWDLFEHCWRPHPQQRMTAEAAVSWLQRHACVLD